MAMLIIHQEAQLLEADVAANRLEEAERRLTTIKIALTRVGGDQEAVDVAGKYWKPCLLI